MLESVDVGTQCISSYEPSAGADSLAQLRELAAPLSGARVLHINATSYGGGDRFYRSSFTRAGPYRETLLSIAIGGGR